MSHEVKHEGPVQLMDKETREVEFTIKSGKNGNFEVSSDNGSAYSGQVQNRNGVDFVQFSDPQLVERSQDRPNSRSSMMYEEATLQIDGLGDVKRLGVETMKAPTHNADPRFLVGTLQDAKGAPCSDLRQAVNNPEAYTVAISGIRTSLANAMRLGMVGVDGTGQLSENLPNIISAINPNDPSLPGADRAKREPACVDFQEPEILALNLLIDRSGLNKDDLYAKALGSDSTAGRDLAQTLGGGVTPQEMNDLLFGAVQVRMMSVAAALERAAKLEPGQGAEVIDHVMNRMSKGQGRRLAHGLLIGHVASMDEALRAYAAGDMY